MNICINILKNVLRKVQNKNLKIKKSNKKSK